MEDKIYIFGHKNPDTDSVCSAIALSYLENVLGYNTEPRILSNINEETKYVLKKFKIQVPKLLNDVRLKVSNINYHKNFKVNIRESVYNAFFTMQNANMSTIPIVDKDEKFLGNFAMKDIAKTEIMGDNKSLKTNYNHILKVINGTKVLQFDDEIDGIITNIDLRSTTFLEGNFLDSKSILIIGDRYSVIEDALKKKVKLIVITDNNRLKEEHLELANKNKINIIYTKNESYDTISKIKFANYIENYTYSKDLTCVNENTDVYDLNEIIKKTRYSYYPVIDNLGHCLGLIKLSDLRDVHPKKVMLVDHNELSQSADGLEDAEIIGIFDHHKLGNLGTNSPINFRNMIVGSTCTIIYELFKENKVKIPEHIASLLMAGIISDTLLLKSPTTTKVDSKTLNELIKITNIDAKKLAMEMFKANDIVKSKSIKDVIYMDFKNYNIERKNIAIGVITTLNAKAILKQKRSYIKVLNKECELEHYDIFLFVITDIFKNGSYILFNDGCKNVIKEAFGEKIDEGDFINNMVSRKKQILPAIINSIY